MSHNVLNIAELHSCAFTTGTGPCLDDFVPSDGTTIARASYYHVCGYPDVFFDGNHGVCGSIYPTYVGMKAAYERSIANASMYPGNVSIVQNATVAPGSMTSYAFVTAALTGSFNVVTYLLEYIGKENVSNGYGPHDIGWVVRETLLNRPIGLIAGETTEVNGSGVLNSSWVRANLSVVTFVQQNSTKIVENANMAPIDQLTPPRFRVSFVETGLGGGSSWSVVLNGTRLNSTGPQITFSRPAGVYDFTAVAPGYQTQLGFSNRSTGVVTVNWADTTVAVQFAWQVFTITFQESGLPLGTGWGVFIGNQSQTSFTSTLTYSEVNGTYGFVVLSPTGYIPTYPGPAVVNGSNTVIGVKFHPQTYPIVLIEFGLPTGSNWSATISSATTGFNQTKSSISNSITFFLSNGTYTIGFTLPPGFAGNASSTRITVAGETTTGPVIQVRSPTHSTNPPATTPLPVHQVGSGLLPALDWFIVGESVAALIVWSYLAFRRGAGGPSRPGRGS